MTRFLRMETNEILEELKIKYRTLTVEDKARLLNYVFNYSCILSRSDCFLENKYNFDLDYEISEKKVTQGFEIKKREGKDGYYEVKGGTVLIDFLTTDELITLLLLAEEKEFSDINIDNCRDLIKSHSNLELEGYVSVLPVKALEFYLDTKLQHILNGTSCYGDPECKVESKVKQSMEQALADGYYCLTRSLTEEIKERQMKFIKRINRNFNFAKHAFVLVMSQI